MRGDLPEVAVRLKESAKSIQTHRQVFKPNNKRTDDPFSVTAVIPIEKVRKK